MSLVLQVSGLHSWRKFSVQSSFSDFLSLLIRSSEKDNRPLIRFSRLHSCLFDFSWVSVSRQCRLRRLRRRRRPRQLSWQPLHCGGGDTKTKKQKKSKNEKFEKKFALVNSPVNFFLYLQNCWDLLSWIQKQSPIALMEDDSAFISLTPNFKH